MSVADLKKELKNLRKTHCPPVSKMKKTDVEKEVARLRDHAPTHMSIEKDEDKKARSAATKEKKAEKIATKLEEVKKAFEPVKTKPVPKKSMKIDLSGKEKELPAPVKTAPVADAPVKVARPPKGSQEAKDCMAQIRAMRGKKA